MRKHSLPRLFLGLATSALLVVGCKEKADPVFDAPTITISPSEVKAGAGAVIPLTITVASGAALKSVTLDGVTAPVKEYAAGSNTKSDVITYQYTVPSASTTLNFKVTDTQNVPKMTSATPVLVSPGLPVLSMIASGDGAAIKKDSLNHFDTYGYKRGMNWLTVGGTFPLADSIIFSARGNKGVWTFNAPAPAAAGGIGGGSALKVNRSNTSDWGGYLIMVLEQWSTRPAGSTDFTAGKMFKKEEMDALKTGDRVFAVDVYFENTDLNHPWATIKNSTGQAGGPKTTEGMKFQAVFTNKGKFASTGEKEIFLVKESYLTEPNKWQTLYFRNDDTNETTKATNPKVLAVPSDKVDRILLVPNFGYPGADSSPFYFKNFRIVPKP